MLILSQIYVLLFISWSAASPDDTDDSALSADAIKVSDPFCVAAGYDIAAVIEQSKRLATHSWEYGTAAEALLEIYNPKLAVFDPKSLPDGHLPHVKDVADVPSLAYARQFIELDNETFINGGGRTRPPTCSAFVRPV